MARPVRGVLVIEGTQTGDGRVIAEGALSWADLPLPLGWLQAEQHGDMLSGATQVGTIDTIERNGNEIAWTGTLDDGQPDGAELARRLDEGVAASGHRIGVSIDPDDYELEIVAMEEQPDEVVLVSAAGDDDTPGEGEVVMEDSSDAVIQRFIRLRIRGATACAIPAFDGAYMELADGAAEEPVEPVGEEGEAVAAGGVVRSGTTVLIGEHGRELFFPAGNGYVAPFNTDSWTTIDISTPTHPVVVAAVPVAPPTEWFADPGLGELTPLTVDDDGRVYGHAAAWGACHIGRPDTCLTAPRSATGYAHFRTGSVVTADGSRVAAGQITLDTGHAPLAAGSRAAAAHYDDTGTAVADVAVGEDAFGIWVAGALRPDVDELRLRRLRASALSGDWRAIGGNLELVGLLCVNVPGFGIPRTKALVASGEGQRSLVAAGVVAAHADCGCGETSDEVAELRARVAFLEELAAPLLASAAAEIEADVDDLVAAMQSSSTRPMASPYRRPTTLRRR